MRILVEYIVVLATITAILAGVALHLGKKAPAHEECASVTTPIVAQIVTF